MTDHPNNRPDDDQPDLDDIFNDGQLHDRARRGPLSAHELRKIVPPHDDSWMSLPDGERAAYARQAVAEGRFLTLLKRPIDSDLLDVVACLRSMTEDGPDMGEEMAVLISNGRVGPMLIVALKLLAELASEQQLDPSWLAVWGSYAIERST